MNAAAGESAVLLAFMAAVLGCLSLVVGLTRNRPALVRAGRTYTWVILAGAVIATIAMQHALITHDFGLRYVADNDSTETPVLFRITAMWSNLSGSILLWGLVLAGWLAAMAVRFRHRALDPLVGWATVVGFAVAAFFFGLMLTASNPFTTVKGTGYRPTDRGRTRCCRTTYSWPSTLPFCTWAWSVSPFHSPLPSPLSSPGGWGRDGSWRHGSGPFFPGDSSLSA